GTFNDQYRTRSGVEYHLISGDGGDFSSRTALGKLLWALLWPYGENDGITPSQSGLTLGGATDTCPTSEVHHPGFGSHSYFWWGSDSTLSESWADCIKPQLAADASSAAVVRPSSPRSPSRPAVTNSPPFNAQSTIATGVLQPEQTATRTLSLPGGATLFSATWQAGAPNLTLIDPNGQRIDAAYAAAHPDLVTYQADTTGATYQLSNAAVGSWLMLLQADSTVPAQGAAYSTIATFNSAAALTGTTDAGHYRPGATATIRATLSGSPATATVTGAILRADGHSDALSFSPAGGGQYQASYTVPNVPGEAEVRLQAGGTLAGAAPFEEATSLTFQIAPNTLSLSGSYHDSVEPLAPGSPFSQTLDVTVGINATAAGTATLLADLVDGAGNQVAHTVATQSLQAGSGTLTLRFDGAEIYASGHAGPYRLTNLVLSDETTVPLHVSEAQNVYTATTSDLRQLGSPKIAFTAQPAGASAGAAFAVQPVVTV
ncbi:MAG: DUF4785 family immunoglobulin-like domain-containing protein, partial [Dehalococcoidia bacterium]